MTERAFVEVHVIQTAPPSNLNRDDAGSPKQAIYGGVQRARLSSQSQKRATRKKFAERQPEADRAVRTKRLAILIARSLEVKSSLDTDAAQRVANAAVATLVKKTDDKNLTPYLLFFGRPQVEAIAELLASDAGALSGLDGKALKDGVEKLPIARILGRGHPAEVALFGRMVADLPGLNVDASTQVAHAISTHEVATQFDYYTAVDDENTREETGAGMIGTIEFNSATLYRYASVSAHQLVENLGGDVGASATAIRDFVDCFATSLPSGRQNSFAANTRPSMVLVVVRKDTPVSYANAFECPVPNRGGYDDESMTRLAESHQQSVQTWGDKPELVAALYTASSPEHKERIKSVLGGSLTHDELLASVDGAVESILGSR